MTIHVDPGCGLTPPLAKLPSHLQHFARDPRILCEELARALQRIQQTRPGTGQVEIDQGFVFVDTEDRRMRRLICIGTGPGFAQSVLDRAEAIAAFEPQFLDVLHVGPLDRDKDAFNHALVERIVAAGWGYLRLIASDAHNAWHSQIELVRQSNDLGEYFRHAVAHDLLQKIQARDALSDDHYRGLVFSCLRFGLHGCLFRGRDHRSLDDRDYFPGVVFEVLPKSRLWQTMSELGIETRGIRFQTRFDGDIDPASVEDFAKDLRQWKATTVGVVCGRPPLPLNFREQARQLRERWRHELLLLAFSAEDLATLVRNGRGGEFERNQQLLIDRIRQAVYDSRSRHEYEVPCQDGSDPDCWGTITNTLDYVGLTSAQIEVLAHHGHCELSERQIRRNWHVLSLAQRQSYRIDGCLGIEESLDSVCAACGSDQIREDDD